MPKANKKVLCHLQPELHSALKSECASMGVTMTDLFQAAATIYVDKDKGHTELQKKAQTINADKKK